MKERLAALGIVTAVGLGIAVACLVEWDPERSRREAYVYHCNEEGAGGMFTSREYCEDLYARSTRKHAAGNRADGR